MSLQKSQIFHKLTILFGVSSVVFAQLYLSFPEVQEAIYGVLLNKFYKLSKVDKCVRRLGFS